MLPQAKQIWSACLTTTITDVIARDIRFPTSRMLDGSDAMNRDPDYSAAYVVLQTDRPDGIAGHGLTFTIGRGNELCVAAIEALQHLVVGKTLESFAADMGAFWHMITGDSQLRWVGPEKGVIHLATAAVVNAVWDLYAKSAGKPLWQLLADMTPEELVGCIDFRYISDALTPAEALDLLRRHAPTKAGRVAEMRERGFPAYTTSAGWLGYSDEKLRALLREAVANSWTHIKMKVGINIDDDLRRAKIIREEIGPDRTLMMDANQVWDVGQAIANMTRLAAFNPLWIEEPTSPADVLGHAAIARAVAPIGVARRACSKPNYLQAAVAGRCDPLLPDRCLPAWRSQRGAGGAADGCQVRRAGLPACRRRRPVRVCSASVDLRLHLRQRVARSAHSGIRRSPARALLRPSADRERPLHAARAARLQHHYETGIARCLRISEWGGVGARLV